MSSSQSLDGFSWWAEMVGARLTADGKPPIDTNLSFPTRTQKGLKPQRLGAGNGMSHPGFYYMGSPDQAIVISKYELPKRPDLLSVPLETTAAFRYMGQWLIETAKAPFIIGAVGLSSMTRELEVSRHEHLCVFNQNLNSFTFNLEVVRRAFDLLKPYPWKGAANMAISLLPATKQPGSAGIRAREALLKLDAQHAGLMQAVIAARITPDSGEHRVLGWYYIQSLKESST